MCGLFYVYARNQSLARQACQEISTEFIAPRGPSHRLEFISSREYICQSVLSIQTMAGVPAQQGMLGSSQFILYNGEIYSFGKKIKGDSDTDKLYYSFLDGTLEETLVECDGMYALVALSGNTDQRNCSAYRDPIGEKHVYYLFDNQYFAIASTPGALVELSRRLGILRYNEEALLDYFDRRHFISSSNTLFEGIRQIPAGGSIKFNSDQWTCLEIQPEIPLHLRYFDKDLYSVLSRMSLVEYSEVLEAELSDCLKNMQSTCIDEETGLTVSGGIDSTIVAALLSFCADTVPDTFSCSFGDKDPIAKLAPRLAAKIGSISHHEVAINLDSYVSSLKRCIRILGAPVHSHSLPSSRILAQHLACSGKKVLYGGEGADELFLGYSTYNLINTNRENLYQPQSAYSAKVINGISQAPHDDSEISNRLNAMLKSSVDMFIESGMSVPHAIIKANAILDFSEQLPMVGLTATDTVVSDCGVEARTPFTRSKIVKFGLSSPYKHLVHNQLTGKPIMKSGLDLLFRKVTGNVPGNKSGFSGYPNETAVFLNEVHTWKVFEQYPSLKNIFGKNRDTDWKIINTEWFLREWSFG